MTNDHLEATNKLSTTLVSMARKSSLAVCTVLVLSACGGGSSEPDTGAGDDALDNAPAMAMTGTVVMEERGGRMVFDGWFSQSSFEEFDQANADDFISEDACRVDAVSSATQPVAELQLSPTQASDQPSLLAAQGAQDDSTDLALATDFTSIGPALKIESRVGEFDSLLKQQVGQTTVYAQEERWQSKPLPDDAVLTFDDDAGFSALGSIQVSPIMPLVWLAPETGVLSNAASALRWEASFDESVQIKLRLTAIDFSDSDEPNVVTIACNVIDDGLFTLPAEFQQKLPDDHTGISVYAVRERVQQIQSNDANLKVVQLSYPAPIKP